MGLLLWMHALVWMGVWMGGWVRVSRRSVGSPPPPPLALPPRLPATPPAQIGVLVDAVRGKAAVPEGFQIIIDSMAGL